MPNDNHIKIFIAYSREDTDILTELRKNLVVLERTQDIDVWYDGEIEVGANWADSIKEELHSADIILLLISQNFIASDYCYDTEMTQALALHDTGKVKVIPVIARECLWKDTPFAKLQALPPEGKPIMSKTWENANRPYFLIANELKEAVNKIRFDRKPKIKSPRPDVKINRPDPVVRKATNSSSSSQNFTSTNIFKIGLPILLLAILGIWLVPKLFNNSRNVKPHKKEVIYDENQVNELHQFYDDLIEAGDGFLLNYDFSNAKAQFESALLIAEKSGFDDEIIIVKKKIEFCEKELEKINQERSEAEQEEAFKKWKNQGDTDFRNKKYKEALANYNRAYDIKKTSEVKDRIKECKKLSKDSGGNSGGGVVRPEFSGVDQVVVLDPKNEAVLDAFKRSSKFIPTGSIANTLYLMTLKDSRDDHEYKVKRLKDNKIWMAENLNYKTNDSWCYNNQSNNCTTYGRIYSLKTIFKVCPDGWRLPTSDDWKTLISKYGGATEAYKALTKDTNVGFNAVLGGVKSGTTFKGLKTQTQYWTRSNKGIVGYYTAVFSNKKVSIGSSLNSSDNAFYCRCIKE